MNSAQVLKWYRVPEVWLILILLGSTIAASLALVVTAARSPDLPVDTHQKNEPVIRHAPPKSV